SANRYLEAGTFLVASAGEKREPLPCRNQAGLRNNIDHVSINLDAFDLCLNEGSTTGYTMVSLSLETEARRGDSFRALRGPAVSLPHFSCNRSLLTGHFKTSQSGSNQNRPLFRCFIHTGFLDAGKWLFIFFVP